MAWTLMTVHIFPLFYHCSTHTKKPRLSLLVYYHLALYFILPPSIDSSHQKALHRKKTGRKFCLKVADPEAKPFAVDNYINGGATGNLTFFFCLEPYCELTPSLPPKTWDFFLHYTFSDQRFWEKSTGGIFKNKFGDGQLWHALPHLMRNYNLINS